MDSELDFIEANQVMAAVDERLMTMYARRTRMRQLREELVVDSGRDYLIAEEDQAIRALESAKRKLSVRWYSEMTLAEVEELGKELEQSDPVTMARGYFDRVANP